MIMDEHAMVCRYGIGDGLCGQEACERCVSIALKCDATTMSVTAPMLAELLKAGPVTIRVPDFGDPCGMRKIARVLEAAYSHDTWDSEFQRMTVGRWQLVFGGEYVYPAILISSGDWQYEVTTDAPEESGPCDRCRAFQARYENATS